MLILRHRSNLKRIWAGTEPKVRLRRSNREGRARVVALATLAIVGLVGLGVARLLPRINDRPTLSIGPAVFAEAARFRTGHQRAGALAFYDDGRRLAVGCPRYNRLVLYRVADDAVEELRDVALHGRPFAIRATNGRIYVLQRPTGDARHLEEGFWQAFDFDGRPDGSKFRVGWDPDDMAFTPDGRWAIVLTSGHAEGEQGKPDPSLIVVGLGDRTEDHRIVARLPFEGPEDDPERLVLSESGRRAAVVLAGARQIVGVDLTDPEHPEPTGRVPLAAREVPYLSDSGEGDPILMPVDSRRSTVLVPDLPGRPAPVLVSTLPRGSALEVVDGSHRRSLGRLRLNGPMNLGSIRPTGLAYCPDRDLLAVAERSGGVRLIAIRDRSGEPGGDRSTGPLASNPTPRASGGSATR